MKITMNCIHSGYTTHEEFEALLEDLSTLVKRYDIWDAS